MSTDQGSQFTGSAKVTTLTEAVYLYELSNGFIAERVIGAWITFYNTDRPHTALDTRTPDEAYFDTDEMKKAAR